MQDADDNIEGGVLSGGLRQIADAIGEEGAMLLAKAFGGGDDYYIPKKPIQDHPFVPVIGMDRMQRLCEAFGGMQIDIPQARRIGRKTQEVYRLLLSTNKSARDIALEVGCTQRHVRRLKAMLALGGR